MPQTTVTKTITVAYQAQYSTICLEPVSCDICPAGGDCAQMQTDFIDLMVEVWNINYTPCIKTVKN